MTLPANSRPFDAAALTVSTLLRRAELLAEQGLPVIARNCVDDAIVRLKRLRAEAGLARPLGRPLGSEGQCSACGGIGHTKRSRKCPARREAALV